jgi:hypothetical protein
VPQTVQDAIQAIKSGDKDTGKYFFPYAKIYLCKLKIFGNQALMFGRRTPTTNTPASKNSLGARIRLGKVEPGRVPDFLMSGRLRACKFLTSRILPCFVR